MIVKIQRPIIGDEALIYNESRRVHTVVPYSGEIQSLFAGGELKVYHKAYLTPKGKLIIKKRAPDQDW